jgi:hypothetical protein
MKSIAVSTTPRLALALLVGALVIGLGWPLAGVAQDKPADTGEHKHADKSADADKDLAAQVRGLQAKIAKLEAALKQGHKGTPFATPDSGGMAGMPMGMMSQKKGPGAMDMGGMAGMNPDEMKKMMQMMEMMGSMGGGKTGMGGMSMMDMDMEEMMAMMGMGSMSQSGMKGMGKMRMVAALPGFPGASHIYHIGATGFFLDHSDHITLTTKQQTGLNGLKEKTLLEKSSSRRPSKESGSPP